MKKMPVVVLLLFIATCVFTQEPANMRFQSQVARVFTIYVPSEQYAIDWGPSKYGEILNIKFPKVFSTKHDIYVIPNLNIQLDRLSSPVDLKLNLNPF